VIALSSTTAFKLAREVLQTSPLESVALWAQPSDGARPLVVASTTARGDLYPLVLCLRASNASIAVAEDPALSALLAEAQNRAEISRIALVEFAVPDSHAGQSAWKTLLDRPLAHVGGRKPVTVFKAVSPRFYLE
jgi:hypothetical protein